MSNQNKPAKSFEEVLEYLLTRADNGESPRLEECLARYPQFADELRKFFDDMSIVDDRLAGEKRAGRSTGTERWVEDDRSSEPSPTGHDESRELPQLKRFLVLEELGRGSQGVVYKAQQRGTKRIVALKIIREGAFASKTSRRRFEREVELASRLNHPNVVGVYECGQDSGRDYFAMEWVGATQTCDSSTPLATSPFICIDTTIINTFSVNIAFSFSVTPARTFPPVCRHRLPARSSNP